MTRVRVQAQPRPRHVTCCDWDKEELRPLLRRELIYTIRSSKYPRTLENPTRVTLLVDAKHAFSVHALLLKAFSKTLWSRLQVQASSSPTSSSEPVLDVSDIAISISIPIPIPTSPTAPSPNSIPNESPTPTPNPNSIRSTTSSLLPAWQIFTDWLYTFDKIPLPDYTPLRPPSRLYTTPNIVVACLLADKLGGAKFEKWLFRMVHKEVWEGDFDESTLPHLHHALSPKTGLHHFITAYQRWQLAGRPAELDPYRCRIEHWYSICGNLSNWGCFHTMSPSGWGGVWERQRERAGEYEADVGDLVCGGGCEDEGEEGEGGGEGEDERVGGYESEEGSEGGSWSSETSDERFWEDEEEDGYEYLRADQHRPDGVEEERVFGLKLLEEGLRGYLTPDEEEFLIEL